MARQVVPLLVALLGCDPSEEGRVSDTDAFAPDHPKELIRTTHISSDVNGIWEVRVPKVLERKVRILRASVDGWPANRIDPPLSEAEQVWYDQAADPEHPYVAWYRCSQRCQFEIRDSSIWNTGYYPYSRVGSGLMNRAEVVGRDVTFKLEDHDPNGMGGVIKIRMNREWTAFRVTSFELDGYRDPYFGQKLELYYERVAP